MSSDDGLDLELSDSDDGHARMRRRRLRKAPQRRKRSRRQRAVLDSSSSDGDDGDTSDSDFFANEASSRPSRATHSTSSAAIVINDSSSEDSAAAAEGAAGRASTAALDQTRSASQADMNVSTHAAEDAVCKPHSVPSCKDSAGEEDSKPHKLPLSCDLLVIEPARAEVEMESSGTELQPHRCALSIESVNVCGFKNFRDHTEVGPFSAFTCIVGPNGAGKSSILDAIAFVFGSKTSDLRGSSLSNLVNEELLQRGAQNASTAETISATVTVNMQAFDRRMAVGRRIIIPNASQLSTARSEYTLDGKKRSRGDIKKLLAEYGINIDMQSRFILLQSRTVNIIRQGPVQLLNYLEEIVGTLQIRALIDQLRQQESSHQLQLDEIQAALADVASKREDLKPKVKAYASYTATNAEYICRRAAHLLKNEIIVAHQLERAAEVRKDCVQQQAAADSILSNFTEDMRANKTNLTKAKRNAANTRRRFAKAEEAEQEFKCETRKLTVQRRRAEKTASESQQTLKTINTKLLELQATDAALSNSAESLSTSIIALSTQIKSKQVLESSLNDADRQKIQGLRISLAKFQQKIKESNRGRVGAQLAQVNARRTELDEKLSLEVQNNEKLVQAQSEVQALLDARSETKQRVDATDKNLQQQLNALQHAAEQAATKVSNLQQLSQDSRAVRYRAAVRMLSQKHAGVRGLLCDLGGCQRQHEAAVNSVLWGALGATVVVDARTDGIHVTDYFREHRIGFVSCSILTETNELSGSTTSEKLQMCNPTQLTNLGDVIQCLPIYKPLWRRLCSGWCIASDQPAANQYSKQCNIVTATGLIFKHDGEMRSSNYCRDATQHDINALMVSSTSLQRPSLYDASPSTSGDIPTQLAKAEAALRAAQAQVKEKRTESITSQVQQRQAASQGKQAKAALSRLKTQLSASKVALAEVTKDRQRLQERTEQLQDSLSQIQLAVEASERNERQIEQLLCSGDLLELRTLRQEADSKSTELQKQNEEIQRVQAALRGLLKEVAKQEKKQTTATAKLDTLSSSLMKLENSQADAKRNKQDASKQQADVEEEVSALEKATQEQQKKLKVIQADCAAQRRVLEDAQQEEKQLRLQRSATAQEIQKMNGDVADSLASVREVADAMFELQLGHEQPEGSKLKLAGVAHREVVSRLDENDEDELTREMNEEREAVAVLAKQRNDAWKHVDMQAVKEDDRLKTHERELTGKQSAKYQTMEELGTNREAQQALREKRFSQGMKKVNSETARLYKELSVHGDICLSAPVSLDANSIEEGVQMFCKETLISPAWKPVELLSGGQQALAALALTLGMSAVYPCPFYCVDEIDAALDTRAVAAVARVVERLSLTASSSCSDYVGTDSAAIPGESRTVEGASAESCEAAGVSAAPRSQFVVVSHRPQMYERAERLIGVYTEGGQQRGASTTCGWNAHRRT